jgi:hypothetical protein
MAGVIKHLATRKLTIWCDKQDIYANRYAVCGMACTCVEILVETARM